jgi:hypothetical protein
MKYLKHYWISVIDGGYCCHENPVEKRHPEAEFPGLDVRIWMHDEDGIDVCLSQVPDSTPVADIFDIHDETLKVVQVLTEVEFNSVQNPLDESTSLRSQAQQETDETIKEDLEAQADTKFQEAQQALFAL